MSRAPVKVELLPLLTDVPESWRRSTLVPEELGSVLINHVEEAMAEGWALVTGFVVQEMLLLVYERRDDES